MSWKKIVLNYVKDLCAEKGRHEFTLSEIYQYESKLRLYYPKNHTIKEKIRQTLQYLRDEGHITFIDNRGNYKLK